MISEARISAVAYPEGDGWVVQGIEYDITAHALNPLDLPDAFMKAVAENLLVSAHLHGGEPFKGIGPAPARFRVMFERAKQALRTLEKMPCDALPCVEIDDIRVVRETA